VLLALAVGHPGISRAAHHSVRRAAHGQTVVKRVVHTAVKRVAHRVVKHVATPVSRDPAGACVEAVAGAERTHAIPGQLLAAISRVESGRRDRATGVVRPWPWTVNVNGQSFYYADKAQAVAAVRIMQADGVHSIDVGCGQINLMYHPDAFPNLETAFDPEANAKFAAHFLRALYVQTGDWHRAAAMYHSATPELGAAYLRKVLAVLPGGRDLPGDADTVMASRAHGWGASAMRTSVLGDAASQLSNSPWTPKVSTLQMAWALPHETGAARLRPVIYRRPRVRVKHHPVKRTKLAASW
jgi:hypothetical protein